MFFPLFILNVLSNDYIAKIVQNNPNTLIYMKTYDQ